MINNNIYFGHLDPSQFDINELELSARIGNKVSISDYKEYIDKYNSVARYKYAYIKLSVHIENDICYFGDCSVRSASLTKVLDGCKEAIFLAVTSGIESDRLIAKANVKSNADAFIFDAIGSTMVESFMNQVYNNISSEIDCTKRFSPGYSDFPLDFQRKLLEILHSESTVGISLTNELLMIPMKSITAVIGVY